MWSEKNNQLYKKFIFKDFNEAWEFLTNVALLAKEHNHHPTLMNTYNIVEIYLSTHDKENSITGKDTLLASAIDKL